MRRDDDQDQAARRARAEARRGRALLQRGTVAAVEPDPSPLRGAAAISLVHRLTRESWALAGLAEPSYPRDRIPCRFVPGRER